MTLQEALKTGKRFKRKGELEWQNPEAALFNLIRFSVDSILSEDWEIEPEKEIILTKSKFFDAVHRANQIRVEYRIYDYQAYSLADQLGL